MKEGERVIFCVFEAQPLIAHNNRLHLQSLSYSLHAALSLLYPFRFEICIIPLVPPTLVDLAMATFPFVLGCHASLRPLIQVRAFVCVCMCVRLKGD